MTHALRAAALSHGQRAQVMLQDPKHTADTVCSVCYEHGKVRECQRVASCATLIAQRPEPIVPMHMPFFVIADATRVALRCCVQSEGLRAAVVADLMLRRLAVLHAVHAHLDLNLFTLQSYPSPDITFF